MICKYVHVSAMTFTHVHSSCSTSTVVHQNEPYVHSIHINEMQYIPRVLMIEILSMHCIWYAL